MYNVVFPLLKAYAATFGWLCVETYILSLVDKKLSAATFGWLCVETSKTQKALILKAAATFGWLCVETFHKPIREER